ncbi:Sap-like sulfolipid-1-addressing protein [Glaciihabitans tibetensis]|uniref:Sap-like sulfolipid-1-addressing protein n=1 Tax=Glaciihabitans tibetensis TaxID=1266600 RepID=A0A2T0V6S6_9MICO|nr:GAP family protein [Glaciihabitans tibetensis]PRY65895.1 Sap-like sulfolipid-1-addressing protein [Glaciihabitans tibetensis]
MTIELGGALVLLALVDSLSLGTLLIPLLFLRVPGRVPVARIGLYLATISLFYFVAGIALTWGAQNALAEFGEMLSSRPAYMVQLVLGVGLLAAAFWIGRKRDVAGASSARVGEVSRLGRLRERALSGRGGAGLVIALALAAGLVELATMLPYLGAIGLITRAELAAGTWLWVLAGYCLVMILPALLLTALRAVASTTVEPILGRASAWMQKNSAENTAWIVGIVGFLLARDAAVVLDLFG